MDGCPLDSDTVKCQKKSRKKRRRKKKTVRTLYISGLPADVKPREVYLMFCSFTGYQGSIILMRNVDKKPFPVAFVTFENREYAKVAELALHGKRFDPAGTLTMHIEFAKEDTKRESRTDIVPASLNIQSNTLTSPQQLESTHDIAANNNSVRPQGSTHFGNWNYNNNASFSQPFRMGLTSLPSNYPGTMMPTPPVSQPHPSHEFIPYPGR